jgi:hypothetical protein
MLKFQWLDTRRALEYTLQSEQLMLQAALASSS